jgi:hypothetical protein
MRTNWRWRNSDRLGFAILLLPCLTAGISGFATSRGPDKDNKQIEIRISLQSKIVRVGEPLEVRVEVWNVGSEELFIEKDIYEPCVDSPLSFHLNLGPPIRTTGHGNGCAADCGDDRKDSFASHLVKLWVPLPVGRFYGTLVRMPPYLYPQLETPGRWRLQGKYSSKGDLPSSRCFFQVPSDPEQTAKLPYKAWHGIEDTNSVWVEVVGPTKSGKQKR